MRELKIDEKIWNAASEDQRRRVIEHLQQEGILEAGDRLVPEARKPRKTLTLKNRKQKKQTLNDKQPDQPLGYSDECQEKYKKVEKACNSMMWVTIPGIELCNEISTAERNNCLHAYA